MDAIVKWHTLLGVQSLAAIILRNIFKKQNRFTVFYGYMLVKQKDGRWQMYFYSKFLK